MVLTKKFSEFIDGGNLEAGDTTVGLRSSLNTRFVVPTINIDLWLPITGATENAAVNRGYVPLNDSVPVVITLPAIAPFGSIVAVQGYGLGGWELVANTGQTIRLITSVTSSAGSLASATSYDAVEVVCVVANSAWTVRNVLSSGLTIT